MRAHNIVNGPVYKEFPLQQTLKGEDGYHSEILDAIYERLQSMLGRRWTFAFAATVTYPRAYSANQDNRDIREFIERVAGEIRLKSPVHYVWVREQNLGCPNPHYHILFLADGDRICNGWKKKTFIEDTWARVLRIPSGEGYVEISDPEPCAGPHTPDYGCYPVRLGMMIDSRANDFDARLRQVLNWVSYWGKVKTKVPVPGRRSWGASQL